MTTDLPFILNYSKSCNLTAYSSGKDRISYNVLNIIVADLVETLTASGFKNGDCCLITHNDKFVTLTYTLAVWYIGGVIAPLNNRWPKKKVFQAIKNLNAKLVITDEDSDLSHKLVKNVSRISLLNQQNSKEYLGLKNLAKHSVCCIMHTSGSSSDEKAMALTYANLYYSCAGLIEYFKINSKDNILVNLPLFHIAGFALMLRGLWARSNLHDFSLADILDKNYKTTISIMSVVPLQLNQIIHSCKSKEQLKKIQNMKLLLVGGSQVSESLKRACRDYKLPAHESYGCTEMASTIATNKINNDKGFTVLPYRKVKILNNLIQLSGETLAPYQIIKSKFIPTTKDGWFISHDLAKWHGQHFKIEGRNDRVIISAGVNINLTEIENALELIKVVKFAHVVGIQDDQFGQRPVAVLQFKDNFINGDVNQDHNLKDSIARELSHHLESYKIPHKFYRLSKPLKMKGIKIDQEDLKERVNNKAGMVEI